MAKAFKEKQITVAHRAAIRSTINFPPDIYNSLEAIAKEKKVSLAWVVRDAVEKYMDEKWPLFGAKHD